LADYASSYRLFKQAQVEVAAVSVDPAERSAAMCRDLGIEFPVLSDGSRETITEWGLLNLNEKGGIAFPATFLIDRGLVVRFSTLEETTRRVPARSMLAFVKALELKGDASPPIKQHVSPGLWFVRAIANAFRHGVRVKRS
jgi:peroxiredoxin